MLLYIYVLSTNTMKYLHIEERGTRESISNVSVPGRTLAKVDNSPTQGQAFHCDRFLEARTQRRCKLSLGQLIMYEHANKKQIL